MFKKKAFYLIISLAFAGVNAMAQSEPAEPAEGTPEFEKAVQQKVRKILEKRDSIGPGVLNLGENQEIALEIADKNPYAAFFFAGLYGESTRGTPIMAKSPRGGSGAYDPTLTSERVKELINKYHNGEVLEKIKPNKDAQTRFIMEYELVKTADGAAYLTFEIALADKQNREIEKMLPNIRVNLKRVGDDGDNGKWKPIGWEIY